MSACMTLIGAVGVWGLASLPPHPALSHVLCLLLAIGCLLAGNNTVMGGAGIVDVVELGSAGDAGVSRARLPGASGVVVRAEVRPSVCRAPPPSFHKFPVRLFTLVGSGWVAGTAEPSRIANYACYCPYPPDIPSHRMGWVALVRSCRVR